MDIAHVDPVTGRTWDLSDPEVQQKARKLFYKSKPSLLVASPPCTLFSQMQYLSGGVKDIDAWNRAVAMLEFAVEMCVRQAKAGRIFVFEHPAYATSWKLPCLERLQALPGSRTEILHMCRFGMRLRDKQGEGLVFKPTRLCTNSEAIGDAVGKKCLGGHRHVHLESGRPRLAQEYPPALCDAILDGLEVELQLRVQEGGRLYGVHQYEDMCDKEEEKIIRESMTAIDDNTGEELDPVLVKKARDEELDGFEEFGVYETELRSVAENDEEAKFIGVRWVDVNKGTAENPEVRSRLVGQEFAAGQARDDLFAATPPLAAARMMVSGLASRGRAGPGSHRLMILDIKKAFLYGKIRRKVFIELPAEDKRSNIKDAVTGRPMYVGRLLKAMYGTRDAPQVWQAEISGTLEMLGFHQSVGSPCVYYNTGAGVRAVVHVDDFLVTGPKDAMNKFKIELEKKYKLKGAMLGPGGDEEREGRFLGRKIRWTSRGMEWEGDQKLVRSLKTEWGMQECKGVGTPGIKEEAETVKNDEIIQDKKRVAKYRRGAAQLNYLALDNPKIAYASKEVSRLMANPTEEGERKLKRAIRFLHDEPTVVYQYRWQDPPREVSCFTDSDWAGCIRTRRSTSGGVAMMGNHCIHHWSRTQVSVALSSGEAELNATLKGGCEGMGLQTIAHDLGWCVELDVLGDSSACKGTLAREGFGKMKHLETRQLWMQEKVKKGALKHVKISRTANMSDALTHAWTTKEGEVHFKRMNIAAAEAEGTAKPRGGA